MSPSGIEATLLGIDSDVVVATTLNAALAEGHRADVRCALLEANLGSIQTYQVADILRARAIPFAFINSDGTGGLDRAYWSAPLLVKPFKRQQLHEMIDLLVSREPSSPLPADRRR